MAKINPEEARTKIVWNPPESISMCVTLCGDLENDSYKSKHWKFQVVGIFAGNEDSADEKERILGTFDMDITERIKLEVPEMEELKMNCKPEEHAQARLL